MAELVGASLLGCAWRKRSIRESSLQLPKRGEEAPSSSPKGGGLEGAGGALSFGEGGERGLGVSCLLEWHLNRDIAYRTQQLLLSMDYDARLLVPEDADVPLRDRIRRANEMCHEHQSRGGIWPNRLLVNIHSNAGLSQTLPKDFQRGGLSPALRKNN